MTLHPREVSILHRAFTLDGVAVEVVRLAMQLPDEDQERIGDLGAGREFQTTDGRIVKRTR